MLRYFSGSDEVIFQSQAGRDESFSFKFRIKFPQNYIAVFRNNGWHDIPALVNTLIYFITGFMNVKTYL